MQSSAERIRLWLVLALVTSAVLFGIGSLLEKAGEGGEAHEEGASEGPAESREALFGVDYEAPVFVALGVVASLALAALVWFLFDRGPVVAGAALFALAFLVLDLREVWFQTGERAGIAAIASGVALLHGAVVALAVMGMRRKHGAATG